MKQRSKYQGGVIEVLAAMPTGKLLNIPAGEGEESADLRARGFQVYSADLFPYPSHRAQPLWLCADANSVFPVRDASVDYVLSREGIEHLENQAGFIEECARVLKPGGMMIVTTPNLMHLSARVSQLLSGQRNLGRGLANEVQTLRATMGRRRYHGHIFLIDYFRLRYLLRLAGFDGLRVATDRYSPTSFALAWLVPPMYAASRWSIRAAARKAARKGAAAAPAAVMDEIMRHVFSPALLFGKRMMVIARKAPA